MNYLGAVRFAEHPQSRARETLRITPHWHPRRPGILLKPAVTYSRRAADANELGGALERTTRREERFRNSREPRSEVAEDVL